MPKKNDVWIIGAVLAVALVLFITWNAFRDRSRRLDTLVPQETQAPQIDETVGADNHAQATEAEADGSAAGEPVFFGPALPEKMCIRDRNQAGKQVKPLHVRMAKDSRTGIEKNQGNTERKAQVFPFGE